MSIPTKLPTRMATIGELRAWIDATGESYMPQLAKDVNGKERLPGKPFFTGYYAIFDNYNTFGYTPEVLVEVPIDLKPVLLGHWLWWNPRDIDRNLQVAVPSLAFSIYGRATTFNLGTERFALDAPRDLLDKACQVGYAKLLQLVADLESGKLDEESIA